jgi:hypothetical protein
MRAPHRRAVLPTFVFTFLLLSSGIVYLEFGRMSSHRGALAPRPSIPLAQNAAEVRATGNPSTAPLKWAGLLVNTDVEGDGRNNSLSCTGQFIAMRVVLTAAHCVQDPNTGVWYDVNKMYFLLQYQNNQWSELYHPICVSRFDGFFPPTLANQSAEVRNAALEDRFQWDYAMVLVDHDSATGYFNGDVNWAGKYQSATMIGYPLAMLDGQIIQTADGEVRFAPDRRNIVELVHKQRPDLTQGTSGGAWVANFFKEEAESHNIVLSVSSYTTAHSPGVSFGPYLTADYHKLLDHVSRGCPH